MRRAIFLDRDGVINENRPNYVLSPQQLVFFPQALNALAKLASSEYAIVIITNQSAVGRGLLSLEMAHAINASVVAEIRRHGGRIDRAYLCPHHPAANCACRKPRPGMLLQAAADLNLDLANSFLVGDAVTDCEAALAVGVSPFLVLTGRGREQLPLLQQRGLPCPIVPMLTDALNDVTATIDR